MNLVKYYFLLVPSSLLFAALSFSLFSLENTSSSEAISSAQKISQAFIDVAEKVSDAVVFIKVEKKINRASQQHRSFNSPFDPFQDDLLRRFFGIPNNRPHPYDRRHAPSNQYHEMGQGSGFIISKDGYILTNNHVVGEADRVTVTLTSGKEYDAKIVGTDADTDVAVIKIENGNTLPFIPLGSSEDLQVGEWIIAVGNPFGLNHTVTTGVVSAKGRSNMGITEYEDFIQTDAAINPGNSGGPLLNLQGEVVGINTAIFSRYGGYMGIGFAIPIDMARKVHDQLIESGKVQRGFLGITIQELTDALAQSFDIDSPRGILVADVAEDTPASKAGIQQGDVIVKLNGHAIDSTGTFRNDIALLGPNSEIDLSIIRNGKEKELSVTLGSQEGKKGFSQTTTSTDLGFEIENLTPEYEKRFGYTGLTGVLASKVNPHSRAAQAGIRPGTLIQSVNRHTVANRNEFQKVLAQADDTLLLLIRDNRGTRYVTLALSS